MIVEIGKIRPPQSPLLGLLVSACCLVTFEGTAAEGDASKTTQNEALLELIEGSDFESLFDISLDHNHDWEVGTPTKISQKSTRSPASVTVISAQQIQMYGYNSLADILNHLAGFSSTNDLVQSSFGIRGIHPGSRAGNRNFKVMIDGQEVSFSANSQNFIDSNLIPMSMVERIEIIKGPVSALYGANAFLGVINLVSKTSEAFIRKGELLSLQWQDNGYTAQFAGGDQVAGWDINYGLYMGHFDLDGLSLPRTSPNYDEYADHDGDKHLVSQESDNEPLSLYVKTRYRAEDDSDWQVGLHYQQLVSDSPFADLNALHDSGYSRIGIYNGFMRVDHVRPLTETLSLNANLAYKQGGPLTADRVELGSEQFYYERNIAYHSYQYSAELNWLASQTNHWLLGVDQAKEHHELETFERVDKATKVVTPLSQTNTKRLNNFGIYLQWLAQWKFGFDTIFGARLDHNKVYDNQESFRLGVVYPLNKKHSVKLLYGNSFQAPSMELLYRQPIQRGDVIGNPNLKSQQADTLELVVNGELGEFTRYTATAYHSTVDDLVVYRDDQNNLSAINAATAKTSGLEVDIIFDSDALNFYLNFGWQHIQLADNSLFVLENRRHGELFPKYTVSSGISYLWDNGLRLSLDNYFNDNRPASTNNVLEAETFYEIDAFVDTQLTLQQHFKWFGERRTEVKLQILDLWDNQYVQPGFGGIDVPSQGRRYRLTLSQRF